MLDKLLGREKVEEPVEPVVEEPVVEEPVVEEPVVEEPVVEEPVVEEPVVDEGVEIEVEAPANPNPLVFLEESVTIYPNGKPTVVAAGEQRMSEAKITLLEQCGKQVKRI